MDILEYQNDRTSELTEFETEYEDLKAKYMSLLSEAIYETDPSKQASLIKEVLQMNSELVSHVKTFIGSAGKKKYNPTTIEDLTKLIVEYQEEQNQIKKSNDEVQTLKDILLGHKDTLSSAKFQYNILLAILLISIIVILFLIMRSSVPILPTQAGGSLLRHLR